jgi:hypothetical protein
VATARDMKTGRRKGILVAALSFKDDRFSRADLVFTGVDHSADSYEVLVFLNNPAAVDTTPHNLESGYGGRFVIFGHGGCYGEAGHCDVPETRTPDDLRLPHPLTPATKIVTVTEALRFVLAQEPHELRTVTLVPIAMTPRRKDRGITTDLFKFGDLSLRTYLAGTDSAVPSSEQFLASRRAALAQPLAEEQPPPAKRRAPAKKATAKAGAKAAGKRATKKAAAKRQQRSRRS